MRTKNIDIRVKSWRRLLASLTLVGLALFVLQAPPRAAADTPETHQFNIQPQSLASALLEFSKQADRQVVGATDAVRIHQTSGVSGNLTIAQALEILLQGTGLNYELVGERSVRILSSRPAAAPAAMTVEDVGGSLRLVQAGSENGAQAQNSTSSVPEEAAGSQGQEVVVTGSRLTRKSAEGAQAVRTYGREEIQRSGQSTVVGFLNALPSVSLSHPESTLTGSVSQTTVSLRGLPVGNTLVLINGQRVETSGTLSQQGAFDLNNIPIEAVESVEVLASGTSIYGSDAIAGVVNISLKRSYEGLHLSTRYGGADGTDESSASLAWGNRWQRGGLSLIGTYQTRSELSGAERELTATNDYRKFGGPNNNRPTCFPGNVFFPNGYSFNGGPPVPFAAVPAGLTGSPTAANFAATAGTLNTCGSLATNFNILPATRRAGLLISGEYDLGDSVSVFSDLLYSRTEQQDMGGGLQRIGSAPTFQNWTVPATNPYNPFGTTVAVAYAFPAILRTEDAITDFGRAVLGAKGRFGDDWAWELSYIHAQDWTDNPNTNYNQNQVAIRAALNSSNPATALNPFIDGSPGSPELVQTLFQDALFKAEGRRQALNGLVRGPILELPAGAVQLAVGSEYARERTYGEAVGAIVGDPSSVSSVTDIRETTAVFAEARVPLLAARDRAGDVLALTLAARYDDYSDFGGTSNPQFAAEWRPLDSLLIRATYAEAFRAPSLRVLKALVQSAPANNVIDPRTGQPVVVASQFGGNPELEPEVGQSETFGLVYWSKMIPDLQLSLTHWKVEQDDTIQNLSVQAVVDNEATFPARVIRSSTGALQSVDARALNFGGIDVAGLDYDLHYQRATSLGTWSGSVSATQFHDYDIQIAPGVPSRNGLSKANTTGNWAPRWKGATTVGWERGPYSMSFTGRYVSSYQDYGSTREIGNFWLYDAHFRYGLERTFESAILKGFYLEFGAVNLFDSLPQYSNFNPSIGYDPAQADIRGRHLYIQLGTHL